MSEITLSGAGRCNGRGRVCGGKHSDGCMGRSSHSSAGTFVCSGGDHIGLGMLTRSLARSLGITVFAALAFNDSDGLLGGVSNDRTGFLLWVFSGAHDVEC